MARRKSALSQAINLKPRLYRGFSALTAMVPALKPIISFYPEIEDVALAGGQSLLDDTYRIQLSTPAYSDALAALAPDNCDVHRDNIILRDSFVAKRGIWIVPDVLVPGHRLIPVNPATFRQIGVGRSGSLNWNHARPWLLPLKTAEINQPAMAVPAIWNMWHLMVEFLIPLAKAAQLRAWGDAELLVLTRPKRPRVIDALVDGLRQTLGVRIQIADVEPNTHLKVKQLLIADSVCWNVERSFAFPETLPILRGAIRQSYADAWPAAPRAERLYITRGASKLRQITNEADVIALMQQHDFDILEARWDAHMEQVAAFSAARHIVGVHGAGMTNIIFSDAGSRVLEIFPSTHRKTSMLHLCAEIGHHHTPFFGSDEGRNQAFSVDIERLTVALQRFLAA